MTGLSAKMLWWAYTQTGYVSRHPNDDPRRVLRAKLHDALTAKLDADAQERNILRLQLTGAQGATRMVMDEFRACRETQEGVLRQARAALLQPVAMGEWEDWWLECTRCHGKGPVQDGRLSSVVHREDCEREKLLAAIDAALEDTCSTS